MKENQGLMYLSYISICVIFKYMMLCKCFAVNTANIVYGRMTYIMWNNNDIRLY